MAHFGLPLLAFGELFSALLPRCRRHTPSGRPEPHGLDLSPSLVHATGRDGCWQPAGVAGTVELEYPLLDASAVKLDLM